MSLKLKVVQHFSISVTIFFDFTQFLSKSVDEVDSEEWACSLGAEMTAQIPLYTHLPEEKVHVENSLLIEYSVTHSYLMLTLLSLVKLSPGQIPPVFYSHSYSTF